jgi:hypothetical protein
VTPADRLKTLWDNPLQRDRRDISDELNAARETALLHAKALDEARRDLARAQRLAREVERAHKDEIARLREANRELNATLEAVRKVLG